MQLLEIPTEILQPICRLLVAKNTGLGRALYITSTVCLKYNGDPDDLRIRDQLECTFYNANPQVLRVCRRLHHVGTPIIYAEHRFACLHSERFMRSFAVQIGECNLQMIARLHLREPKTCRLQNDEASCRLVGFLVDRMPGLNVFELSKRWHTDLVSQSHLEFQSRDTMQRATMQSIAQQLLRRHQQLTHVSWAETRTRLHPEDEDDDPVWTIVTATLSSIRP